MTRHSTPEQDTTRDGHRHKETQTHTRTLPPLRIFITWSCDAGFHYFSRGHEMLVFILMFIKLSYKACRHWDFHHMVMNHEMLVFIGIFTTWS